MQIKMLFFLVLIISQAHGMQHVKNIFTKTAAQSSKARHYVSSLTKKSSKLFALHKKQLLKPMAVIGGGATAAVAAYLYSQNKSNQIYKKYSNDQKLQALGLLPNKQEQFLIMLI
ncbi:MAG: hypothetical protein ACOYT8_06545 [Candidatus Dependentiae bacterium]